MLALYICVGTGVVVWLWLVWDLTREARSKQAAGPVSKPAPKARPRTKPKPGQRRPLGKVSFNRPKRRPAEREPEPEPQPQPPPKPARDPREWMDDDYD